MQSCNVTLCIVPITQETRAILKKNFEKARCRKELEDYILGSLSQDRDVRLPATDEFLESKHSPSLSQGQRRFSAAAAASPGEGSGALNGSPLIKFSPEDSFNMDGYEEEGFLGRGATAEVYRYVNAEKKRESRREDLQQEGVYDF